MGKTTLAKHLCLKYKNEIIFLSGKANDIKYAVFEFTKKKTLRCAIFHYTRSNEQFVSYEAIESIKDGIFFNNKYESAQVIYDCPHIIVFANFQPNYGSLSKDRWKINIISEKGIA